MTKLLKLYSALTTLNAYRLKLVRSTTLEFRFMAKSSIHFRPVKQGSEAHNLRQEKLDYNVPELQKDNRSFVLETIDERLTKIKRHCKAVSGRKLQKNAQPIKEAVVNLNPETSIEDLKDLSSALKDQFGIDCFQIHIHRDEGHTNADGDFVVNHHAHMLFDWQNKDRGTTLKLNRLHMSQIQDIVAEKLNMERGELKVNSNRERLSAIEFKTHKAEEELQNMQEYKENQLKDIEFINQKKKTLSDEFWKLNNKLVNLEEKLQNRPTVSSEMSFSVILNRNSSTNSLTTSQTQSLRDSAKFKTSLLQRLRGMLKAFQSEKLRQKERSEKLAQERKKSQSNKPKKGFFRR